MKKFFTLKFQISLIVLVTLAFTLAGYFYNQNFTQRWYIKYSIERTNATEVYIGAIDNILTNIPEFATMDLLDSFVKKKIIKQSMINKKTFFKNLVISPDIIAFNAEGSLENLDKNLDMLILSVNKNLQDEIEDFIKTLGEINQNISDLFRKFQKDDLTVSLEFYEREGIQPLALTEEASTLVEILLSRSDNESSIEILSSLGSILRDLRNSNSTKFLELELEKLNVLSSLEIFNFEKVARIINKLSNEKIIRINGQIEKVNLSPTLSVSLISFALFGFSLSLFVCVIIGIFSTRIGIKKLKALLDLK
tara:strand:- start:12 stop:935 length:924 start_codon:yes stop_codon:yes gene_type:complete